MASEHKEVPPEKGGSGVRMGIGIVLFIFSIVMQKIWDFEAVKESNALLKLFDLNVPVIIGTIGLIFLLWGVIQQFYTTPLWHIINERNSAIEGTFADVENLRDEMSRTKADYEARLHKTEADAREQIQAQIKEAQELKKQLMADAQAKADALRKEAETEIENQRRQALAELRVHVATLSLQATEKILQENVDNDRNRKLIDDFLTTVEAKN
ncbi:MAG: F0F1 ATP synthase subunit B [Fimbriimonadaceae bacterium]|nr:F0F1 ATP synthase subunit B [Fimbriimonadaceae bacterium]